MPVQTMTQAERRELIRNMILADPQRSDRSIARGVGTTHPTVGSVRRELISAGMVDRATNQANLVKQAHGGKLARGGQSATTHGCYSESRLAPLRAKHAAWALERWPHLDAMRADLVASLAARIQLAREWTDQRGIVRNRRGDTFSIVDRLHTWERQLAEWHKELDAEAKERKEKFDPDAELARIVAEVEAEKQAEDDAR